MEKRKYKFSVVFLSYNQEEYVGEAVRSVLNQIFAEPIQIIISDDFSDDSSFEILKKEVDGYYGNHEVILRRNESNLGIRDHINKVVSIATGEWLVFSAGDDISTLDRVQATWETIKRHGKAVAIQGAYFNMDEKGDVYETVQTPELPSDLCSYVNNSGYVIGASMAYHRILFDYFGPLNEGVVYEDRVLGFRAQLLGQIVNTNRPVMFYRRGIGLSAFPNGDINGKLLFRIKRYRRLICVADQYLQDLRRVQLPIRRKLCRCIIRKHREYCCLASAFSGEWKMFGLLMMLIPSVKSWKVGVRSVYHFFRKY